MPKKIKTYPYLEEQSHVQKKFPEKFGDIPQGWLSYKGGGAASEGEGFKFF